MPDADDAIIYHKNVTSYKLKWIFLNQNIQPPLLYNYCFNLIDFESGSQI